MAQPLSLQNALQQSLFVDNTQFISTNSSTKLVPDLYAEFMPRLSPVDTRHPFLTAYANTIVPAPPLQEAISLSTKADVLASCETLLTHWIGSCISMIGNRYRPIKVLRNSGSLPRILAQDQQLSDVRVDFTFIYGNALEEERVVAVLQTKAVGSLVTSFWQGMEDSGLPDRKMTKEARA